MLIKKQRKNITNVEKTFLHKIKLQFAKYKNNKQIQIIEHVKINTRPPPPPHVGIAYLEA